MNRKVAVVAALALVSSAVGLAAASQYYNLGETAEPAFDAGDRARDDVGGAAPLLLPYLDVVGAVSDFLRSAAYQILVGTEDGDVSSTAGTPDRVGVEAEERTIANRVAVPSVGASVPGREVPVGTAPTGVGVTTPPVSAPGYSIATRPVTIDVGAPGLSTPDVTIHVPPRHLVTPPVGTPPVRVETPGVSFPAGNLTFSYGGVGAGAGPFYGTIYLGPAGSVPYDVPHTGATLDDVLPSEVPRSITVPGGTVDVPPSTIHEEPAHEILPSERLDLPGYSKEIDGVPLTDPVHVGSAHVDSVEASTPPRQILGPQHVSATVPGQSVGTIGVPGAGAHTDEVVVSEEPVTTPGFSLVEENPTGIDDLGRVGYGEDDDSSLYPAACAPGTGCIRSDWWLRPLVEYGDAWLDFATETADGDVVVRPFGPR